MKKLKLIKKSDALMRILGIVAILLCMLSLVLFTDVNQESISKQTVAKIDTAAATLTNSNTEDLALEIKATRGGAELEENGTVYEGEYIKYSFKVTNTTEETMENVKITATIPEGLEYAKLHSSSETIREPYYYEFNEELKEKDIEIATLGAGESQTFYYEAKVKDLADGEAKKAITTKIDSYIGEALAQTYELNTTIKPADLKLFLGSYVDNGGRRYGLQAFSDTDEEVEVELHLPTNYKLSHILKFEKDFESKDYFGLGDVGTGKMIYPEDQVVDKKDKLEFTISEDNVLTTKIKTNTWYSFYGEIDPTLVRENNEDTSKSLSAYAVATKNGYMSNENTIEVAMQNVKISMESSKNSQEVKYGEEIDYNIKVENIGSNRPEYHEENYVNVNVIDFLPEKVKPKSITYDNWEFDYEKETIKDETDGTEMDYVTSKELNKKEGITEKINGTTKDSDGNKLANVNVKLLIPSGESTTIQVKATAGYVTEKTEVTNSAKVEGTEIPTKTSNEITHIIVPTESTGETFAPVQSAEPSTGASSAPTTPSIAPSAIPSAKPSASTENQKPVTMASPSPSASAENKTETVDFKIDTYISKVTVQTANGTKENAYNNETLVKTEIRAKEMDGAKVTVQYKLVVTNQGNVAGTVGKILDYLPNGLTLVASSDNNQWSKGNQGELVNTSKANTRIEPGESATVTLTAENKMTTDSTGTFRNKATIDGVSSVSSKPDSNAKNDSSTAELVISVSTGAYMYISIIVGILAGLILLALYLAKIGKLNIKKITNKFKKASKTAAVVAIFATMLLSTNLEAEAHGEHNFWFHGVGYTWGTDAPGGVAYCEGPEVQDLTTGGWSCGMCGEPTYIGRTNDTITTLKDVTLDKIASSIIEVNPTEDGKALRAGPFKYSSLNVDSFNCEVQDPSGNIIADAQIESGTLTDGENQEFYLIIPNESAKNGVGSIYLTGHGTKHKLEEWIDNYHDHYYTPGQQPIYVPCAIPGSREFDEPADITIEWHPGTPDGEDPSNAILRIIKVDQDEHERGDENPLPLAGVEFTIEGPQNFSPNPTVAKTDENGLIQLNNIPAGKYRITETGNPNYGYTPEVVEIVVDDVAGIQYYERIIDNQKQTGNLQIHKQNLDTGKALEGFGFKLQNSEGKYIRAIDETGEKAEVVGSIELTDIKFVDTLEEATEFITDSEGNIGIYNLLIDKYTIVEVSEGENQLFDALDKDFIGWSSNMGQGTGNEPMQVEVTRQKSYDAKLGNANKVEIIITNRQKYIDISGFVWEDGLDGKIAQRDDVYNEGEPDHLVDNVDVRLIDATTGEVVANRYDTIMEQRTGQEYETVIFEDPEIHIMDDEESQDEVTEDNKESQDEVIEDSTETQNDAEKDSTVLQDSIVKDDTETQDNVAEEDKESQDNAAEDSTETQDNATEDNTESKEVEAEVYPGTVRRRLVRTTAKNEAGHYTFEKIEIDKLNDYYVEFAYNGMSYQSIPATAIVQNAERKNISKAAEDGALSGEQRDSFNNKFQKITHNTATGADENPLELKYDYNAEKHESKLVYGENPVYGWEGCETHGDPDNGYRALYPINDVYEQYIITANTYNVYNGGLDMILSPDYIRQNDIKVLDEVDLGIYGREQPDLAIAKDLKSVKLSINGFNHTYEYDKRNKDKELSDSRFNVGVKFVDTSRYATEKYARAIYRADYNWKNEAEPGKNELEVSLVYRITAKNLSSNVTATVNEMVDYFDKEYEPTIKIGEYDDTKGLVKDGGNSVTATEVTKEGGKFQEAIIDTTDYLGDIEPGAEKDIYVQFELPKAKIAAILDNAKRDPETGELISEPGNEAELDNVTEITSYSTYLDGKVYGGIDEDSNPGTLLDQDTVTDKTIYEDDTDKAPALRLELAERRELQGLTFVDKSDLVDTQGGKTREGDGEYKDTEDTTLDGVKVTLYKVDPNDPNTKQIAKVWRESTEPGKNGEFVEAKDIETSNGGLFEIDGYIPDTYVVEYTWGDDDHPVTDYKATIFNTDAHQGEYWYEQLTPRYSDARDSWDERKTIDDEIQHIYYDTKSEIETTKMHSTTPLFNAEVEYDYDDRKSQYDEELSRKQIAEENEDGIVYRIKNVDFGIVLRPEQSVSLDKTVTHLSLKGELGQVIVDADITPNGNTWDISGMQGTLVPIAKVPKTSGAATTLGEGAVGALRIELDKTLQQSAELEATYKLTATNTSEVDYDNQDWYDFGTRSTNYDKPRTLSVKRVNDYLDTGWNWSEKESPEWTEISVTEVGSNSDKHLNVDPNSVANGDGIKNVRILYTEALQQPMVSGENRSVNLDTVAVLSSAEDVNLTNEAEIIYTYKENGGGLLIKDDAVIDHGEYIPGSAPFEQPDDSKAPTIKIMPNAGANLEFVIPTMIAIAAFAILGTGVVFINRMVLGHRQTIKLLPDHTDRK